MPLYSKSIQEDPHPDDGFRICIMRKPGSNLDWDMWMPTLAPPLTLHKAYQNGEKTWEEYIPIFNQSVIEDLHDHIELLVDMAKTRTVTVLCWEETPEMCHRRLIVEEAQRIDPTLEVIIK